MSAARRAGGRWWLGAAAAAAFLLGVAAAPAAALEGAPPMELGPRALFQLYGSEVGKPRPTSTYVIGDSLSNGVPYVEEGTARGLDVTVRQQTGWSIRFHHEVTTWRRNDLPSFQDAIASGASPVVVELGANDIAGLRGIPEARGPGGDAWREQGRAEVTTWFDQVVGELLDAGACVVWAGPFEVPFTYFDAEDAAWFNQLVRDRAASRPGRLVAADLEQLRRDDPTVRDDVAASDGLHPKSTAARGAIARYLLDATSQCAPSLAPPVPPTPAPTPAPAPPAPTPAATLAPVADPQARLTALAARLRRGVLSLSGSLTGASPCPPAVSVSVTGRGVRRVGLDRPCRFALRLHVPRPTTGRSTVRVVAPGASVSRRAVVRWPREPASRITSGTKR